jgi:hypothetical protein
MFLIKRITGPVSQVREYRGLGGLDLLTPLHSLMIKGCSPNGLPFKKGKMLERADLAVLIAE